MYSRHLAGFPPLYSRSSLISIGIVFVIFLCHRSSLIAHPHVPTQTDCFWSENSNFALKTNISRFSCACGAKLNNMCHALPVDNSFNSFQNGIDCWDGGQAHPMTLLCDKNSLKVESMIHVYVEYQHLAENNV